MTKDEFIQQAVLAQMGSVLLLPDHLQPTIGSVIIENAKSMANELEKDHIFDQESTNDILSEIRNSLTDET